MQQKKEFIPPKVKTVDVLYEKSLLVGSVLHNIEYIESTGQDVETLDFGDTEYFNFYWED